jgi:hypothetical protein
MTEIKRGSSAPKGKPPESPYAIAGVRAREYERIALEKEKATQENSKNPPSA